MLVQKEDMCKDDFQSINPWLVAKCWIIPMMEIEKPKQGSILEEGKEKVEIDLD